MYKEELQHFLDNTVLLRELKKDYREFECFKLKIIDENGNKLKQPTTKAEHLSYSPFVRTIIRIKKYLGPKIDLIESNQLLNKEISTYNESVDQHKKLIFYKDKIDALINELYKTIEEAEHSGISPDNVKKLIRA